MKKRQALKQIAIIAGITLVLIAIPEVIMRLVYPEAIIPLEMLEVAYEFNEDYLISIKPNVTKKHFRHKINGGQVTVWKTNSDSFRGPELEEDPEYRVIVYGDSNVQARFSKREQTYPVQLANYLKESGLSEVEVINAGVSGFGPDQHFIRFSKEVDKYKPDCVIFHIFADNDFGDIIRNRLFDLDSDGNLITTDFEKTVDRYLATRERRNYRSWLLTVRTLDHKLRAWKNDDNQERRVDTFRTACEAEFLIYKESKSREFSNFASHYDMDIALDPDQESSRTKIKLMESVIKQASELAQEKGVKFLVLIQPSIIDSTKDNALLNYEYLKSKYPAYTQTNLSDPIKRICVSQGIDFINLFDVFAENNPEDLFFRKVDNHWNDRGQELAAQRTAEYMSQHWFVDTEAVEKTDEDLPGSAAGVASVLTD